MPHIAVMVEVVHRGLQWGLEGVRVILKQPQDNAPHQGGEQWERVFFWLGDESFLYSQAGKGKEDSRQQVHVDLEQKIKEFYWIENIYLSNYSLRFVWYIYGKRKAHTWQKWICGYRPVIPGYWCCCYPQTLTILQYRQPEKSETASSFLGSSPARPAVLCMWTQSTPGCGSGCMWPSKWLWVYPSNCQREEKQVHTSQAWQVWYLQVMITYHPKISCTPVLNVPHTNKRMDTHALSSLAQWIFLNI